MHDVHQAQRVTTGVSSRHAPFVGTLPAEFVHKVRSYRSE
jgi:hypothetical protein